MANRSEIRSGMTTRSVDGEKLGKIVAMDDSGFTIEKGLFFKKDYLILYEHILEVTDDDVRLALGANELGEAGEEPGLAARAPARPAEATREAAREPARAREETRIPVTEEELEVTKRRKPAGEVRVRKEVVTEQKQIEVPITREEVRVERVPASSGMSAPGARPGVREDDVTIPVMEEEIEINKRPVVKEEIRVSKESYQEQRSAAADARREEVHIDSTGDVRRTDEGDPKKRR